MKVLKFRINSKEDYFTTDAWSWSTVYRTYINGLYLSPKPNRNIKKVTFHGYQILL